VRGRKRHDLFEVPFKNLSGRIKKSTTAVRQIKIGKLDIPNKKQRKLLCCKFSAKWGVILCKVATAGIDKQPLHVNPVQWPIDNIPEK
jgi:hypothetical protein